MLVGGEEYSAKGTDSEDLGLGVNVVVLLELVHALLLVALVGLDLTTLDVCRDRLVLATTSRV